MVTVFSFSHLAYLLIYPFPQIDVGQRAHLLIFLLILTELNDVFQFTWGKLLGRHPIVPKVSPKKTVEGFIGGLISTTALGYGLRGLVALSPERVLILSALIAFVGFYGDITLSAVKREHDIKDMSNLIPGHGGLMDRLDSLAFTSIAFFYLVRLWSQG
jgi:phosphatidate cytidylyltransferase